MTKKTRMNKEVKKLWVDALNSGNYRQTQGQLCDGNGRYCCLGVLTDIYAKAKKKKAFDEDGNPVVFGKRVHEDFLDGQAIYLLHKKVAEWAGIPPKGIVLQGSSEFFDVKANDWLLSELNDGGESFKDIAKLIQKHL